jgi:lysophospholipase L1-like esterase
MKKEWVLSIGVVAITLVVAIGLIRWFAPQLLGIPVDLQAVRVSKEVPPFFENVFRKEDVGSRDFLLKDPYTNIRARPLLVDLSGFGPHDLLGFRNRSIPDIADVIAIGDSQTYGNNTVLAENWPSQLEQILGDKRSVVYSMATGGWCAVQYLNMFSNATFFRPRVIVIAFYSGNDPDESVTLAYSVDHWAPLRPDPNLDLSDKPRFPGFPVPPSEQLPVRFKDGLTTIFTPSLRLVSNDTAHATVRAGYQIMETVAQLMAKTASEVNIRLVLTVIPTKELVYAERVRHEKINVSADYTKLVEMERANIEHLAQSFKLLPNVEYVDLVSALQKSASTNLELYPPAADGHPVAAGNRVIADALAPAVGKYMVESPRGLVGIVRDAKTVLPMLVTKDGVWMFSTKEIANKNGWGDDQIRIVNVRDIAALPVMGTINVVDPKKFGPRAIRPRYAAR